VARSTHAAPATDATIATIAVSRLFLSIGSVSPYHPSNSPPSNQSHST